MSEEEPARPAGSRAEPRGRSAADPSIGQRLLELLRPLVGPIGAKSRAAKLQLYQRHFPPHANEAVLDVGVSMHVDEPNENYFLKSYPYRSQVTAIGVQDLAPLRSRYPEVTFVKTDGKRIPFEDREFAIGHSNAVVEHVGALAEQRRFVEEIVRVADRGLITTPYRWFPVEPHRLWPFLHWLPRPAYLWSLRKLRLLDKDAELRVWLLGRREFAALFPADVDVRIYTTSVAGLPATLNAVFVHRKLRYMT